MCVYSWGLVSRWGPKLRSPQVQKLINHTELNFAFVAKKPGCRSLRINTEACWACCHTWERPVPEPPYIQRHHRVCTYSRTRHLTARLPGCRPGVSPIYYYPQALQCDCTYCSSNHTVCETF
uniref:Si:dkey-23i12.9 n=1 Tax=Sinocyclocheilus grahami TaxID=75366 RepID=A0A672S8Y2_SINGR